jgi:hypothetical protein
MGDCGRVETRGVVGRHDHRMVGSQLAVLIPVLETVTTVDSPVRSVAATAVATTLADTVIVPAA